MREAVAALLLLLAWYLFLGGVVRVRVNDATYAVSIGGAAPTATPVVALRREDLTTQYNAVVEGR